MSKKLSLGKIMDANKEILFDILKSKKIKSFTVRFEGSGDSGQIEHIDLPRKVLGFIVEGAKLSQGTTARGHIYKNDPSVEEIVDTMCCEVLDQLHEGWDTGDGAYGEFLFDVNERTVNLSFNERYMDTELHEHEF